MRASRIAAAGAGRKDDGAGAGECRCKLIDIGRFNVEHDRIAASRSYGIALAGIADHRVDRVARGFEFSRREQCYLAVSADDNHAIGVSHETCS